MDLVTSTMLIYLGINAVGLIWTAATIHFGIPDHMRIHKRPHRWSTLLNRLPLILFNQAILMAVVWGALTLFGDVFTMETPNLSILVVQILIIVLIDDAWFYRWHRFMHEHKALYNKVHRLHHRAYEPLPIEYIYVHPLEWLVGGVGPFLGLILINQVWGLLPAWTLWGYLLVRNLHELDVHSGIKSPLGSIIPIYAAAEHHDLHHAKPTKGNYATTLELWDHIFGTYWRPETIARKQRRPSHIEQTMAD